MTQTNGTRSGWCRCSQAVGPPFHIGNARPLWLHVVVSQCAVVSRCADHGWKIWAGICFGVPQMRGRKPMCGRMSRSAGTRGRSQAEHGVAHAGRQDARCSPGPAGLAGQTCMQHAQRGNLVRDRGGRTIARCGGQLPGGPAPRRDRPRQQPALGRPANVDAWHPEVQRGAAMSTRADGMPAAREATKRLVTNVDAGRHLEQLHRGAALPRRRRQPKHGALRNVQHPAPIGCRWVG